MGHPSFVWEPEPMRLKWVLTQTSFTPRLEAVPLVFKYADHSLGGFNCVGFGGFGCRATDCDSKRPVGTRG